MKTISLALAIVSLFCVSAFANSNNPSSTLKNISNKIASIRNTISTQEKRRDALQAELKQIETNTATVQNKVSRLRKRLNKQTTLVRQLENKSDAYRSQLDKQQKQLRQHIRNMYLLRQQPALKLILNQQDVSQWNRMLVYYRYLAQAQLQLIEQTQITLTKLADTEQRAQQQRDHLVQLRREQTQHQKRLSNMRLERHQLMRRINQTIDSKSKRLRQLVADRRRLQRTIERLERANQWHNIARIKFAKLKGKLPRPTRGKLIALFGTKIRQSELTWSGDLLRAPQGRVVHAVAAGKVIFADWLPGYGLLLIISHGQGYMTLYGRNHTLYKKVDDIVAVGDKIASVGKTGGYKRSALYFAIRHNAKAIDPRPWLRRT